MRKLNIAIIGCGAFARCFVPLFKAHPYTEKVWVCDLIPERVNAYSKEFEVDIIPSFEDALKSREINAVAIFTQRQLHGPLTIAALRAGKHVYSAVPTGLSVEEIAEIERLVRSSGLTFATGETGFYRACSVFCREKFMSGQMGAFVYAEAQYNHDMRNMWESFRRSGGPEWKKVAGFPPMFYPTHSTAMVLGCMPGVYARRVAAFGYEDPRRAEVFGRSGQNLWNNPFSNTDMLCSLSNGGTARISEIRSVGWRSPESYISRFAGTDGTYECSVAHHYFAHWNECEDPEAPNTVTMTEVTEQLLPERVTALLREDHAEGVQQIGNGIGFFESSPIQPTARLPESYHGLQNGHNGCHHFMIDDFCKACYTGKLAPCNIWQSARFNIPGLIAHQSALRDGETMDLPDLGDPPAGWELLLPDGVYGTAGV